MCKEIMHIISNNFAKLNRVSLQKDAYVGIGELKIAKSPDPLIIIGLGSCVGLVLYDSYLKIGGVSHILLPECKNNGLEKCGMNGKFADKAVPYLLKKMLEQNVLKSRITAKIIGGSAIFEKCEFLKIGERNIQKVKEELEKENITIIAEDIGSDYGRTIILDTETGNIEIKTKNGMKYI